MTASAWLLALTLRGTVVLAAALVLERLPWRQTAGARHRLLTLCAAGLLLLPALPGVLPRFELPLVPRFLESSARASALSVEPASAVAAVVIGPVRESGSRAARRLEDRGAEWASAAAPGPGIGSVVPAVWLAGVLVALIGLSRALRGEGRLRAASRPLEGPWLETAAVAARALGVAGPVRLLTSDAVETPLASGWPRAAVLLPPSAEAWPDERRLVVVQHELVHVARGDAWRLLAWRLVAAIYWFHPLARLAERRARLVGEQACDEAVLGLGTRPSAYARHLMEIAESLRLAPRAFAGALPMVDRGQLERRLLMILDARRPSRHGGLAAVAGLALLAAILVAVSAVAPVVAPVVVAMSPGVPAASPGPAAPAARSEASSSACDERMGGSFDGTIHEDASGADATGFSRGEFVLQQRLGNGRRLCARVHGPVRFEEKDGSIRELPVGSSVFVETRSGPKSQRMLVTGQADGPRYEWWLNGGSAAPDAAARAWLADALQVVAAYREIGGIQGKVGTLQGEIGTIQGEIGTLQGEIGTIQGEIGTLQGKIGTIQGEEGSLQGQIGSHQGAIGGLEAARFQASSSLRAQLDKEIATHEAAIRALEAELQSGELRRRMKEAEAELRRAEARSSAQIAGLEREIDALKGDARIGRLESQIADIHADERIHDIEQGMRPALERLNAAIQRLGS